MCPQKILGTIRTYSNFFNLGKSRQTRQNYIDPVAQPARHPSLLGWIWSDSPGFRGVASRLHLDWLGKTPAGRQNSCPSGGAASRSNTSAATILV